MKIFVYSKVVDDRYFIIKCLRLLMKISFSKMNSTCLNVTFFYRQYYLKISRTLPRYLIFTPCEWNSLVKVLESLGPPSAKVKLSTIRELIASLFTKSPSAFNSFTIDIRTNIKSYLLNHFLIIVQSKSINLS